MPWNWELPDWPHFSYDFDNIIQKEKNFLLNVGTSVAFLKNIDDQEYHQFVVEVLSTEGIESSKIEGEILDRESLQSSIRQQFGLNTSQKKGAQKEKNMAKLLCHVYESFNAPLTHEILWNWHAHLFEGVNTIERGKYRAHVEPMQIVSNRYDSPRIFFEAPPSIAVPKEMTRFIEWFNSTRHSESILVRASIAHVYFESIHPFEDGNGRIGRLLVEKVLSQGVERPLLIAVSKLLEKKKKEYYAALEGCNRTLNVGHWMDFFSAIILEAHEESMNMLYFLIQKSRMLTALSGRINPRQEKALLRIFREGLEGFAGGLSAENYISITKTSRATATRDLVDLVEKGALVKTGELRHTRYWLNIKLP